MQGCAEPGYSDDLSGPAGQGQGSPAGERAVRGPGAAQQELQGVQQPVVDADFVVQVRRGGPAGGADGADPLAARDGGAHCDVDRRQVAIARFETVTVVDADQVAVITGGAG